MSLTSGHDVVAAFIAAMHEAGIVPRVAAGHLTADGRLRRFHVQGDRAGTRNGWCVLFGDGIPAGEFGHWRTGQSHRWCARASVMMTADERAHLEARLMRARAERERERNARESRAASLARSLWAGARPVEGQAHPYLQRKGVPAHGLRIVDWPLRGGPGQHDRHVGNTLAVPLMDREGRIVSLQGIFPAVDAQLGRDKSFLPGGQKKGAFFVIGEPMAAQPIAFCEGYATAASVHAASGWCVVVCWDAYNLPAVAQLWREALPHAEFVIAADCDCFGSAPASNVGIAQAQRAAAATGSRVVWPRFAQLVGDPTDFNDLAQREGLEAVRAQLHSTVVSAPAAALPQLADPAATYAVPGNLCGFDTLSAFPDVDGRGRPLPTARNLAELCRRTAIQVRYNTIRKQLEIMVPELHATIDNGREVAMSELLDCMHRVRMPTSGFESSLCAVAEANRFNPVADWIATRPWDGTSRLQAFFDTVTTGSDTCLPDGRSLKEVLMRKWMLSAVAAAYERDGVVARGVLTFVSRQNLGKTRWAKQLAPRALAVIADGEVLNPADRDSVKRVVSKWIVELGEVDATFRKADIAALKAFISRDNDELRRPYARTESRYARRTVFFASVNDPQFLHDPTGNTRWWTIQATALGEPASLNMQQVWAELKQLYDAGETWHLDPVELDALNSHNRDHEAISPVQEMIDREFDWGSPPTIWINPMRATEIAVAAGVDRPMRKHVNEAAAYVVRRYGVCTRKVGKDRCKAWMMPPRLRSPDMQGPL